MGKHPKKQFNQQHLSEDGFDQHPFDDQDDQDDHAEIQSAPHFDCISRDPDYLYCLLRTNQPDVFLAAVGDYYQQSGEYAFDPLTVGKGVVSDVKIPLLHVAWEYKHYKVMNFFLGFLSEKTLSVDILTILLKDRTLARYAITMFPSWFHPTQIGAIAEPNNLFDSGQHFILCDCNPGSNAPSTPNPLFFNTIDPSTIEPTCFCQSQQMLNNVGLFTTTTLASFLDKCFKKFHAYPVDLNGNFPRTLRYVAEKVQIDYEITPCPLQYLFLLRNRYDLIQTINAKVGTNVNLSMPSTSVPAMSEEDKLLCQIAVLHQFKTCLIPNIVKTLKSLKFDDRLHSFEIQMADSLFVAMKSLDIFNWMPIFACLIEEYSPHLQRPPLPQQSTPSTTTTTTTSGALSVLTQSQASLKQSMDQLLATLIVAIQSKLTQCTAHSDRIKKTSLVVYGILHHLVQRTERPQGNDGQPLHPVIYDPIVQYITLKLLPHVCPHHYAILFGILPISILSQLHPQCFYHFASNHRQFNPPTTSQLSHLDQHLINLMHCRDVQFTNKYHSTSPLSSSLPVHPAFIASQMLSAVVWNSQPSDLNTQPAPNTTPIPPIITSQLVQERNRFSNDDLRKFVDPFLLSIYDHATSTPNSGASPFHDSVAEFAVYFNLWRS